MRDVFLNNAAEKSELVIETSQLPEQFAKKLEVDETEVNTAHVFGAMLQMKPVTKNNP